MSNYRRLVVDWTPRDIESANELGAAYLYVSAPEILEAEHCAILAHEWIFDHAASKLADLRAVYDI
jgi:hypothetical protein